MNNKQRCSWVPADNPTYVSYHDDEWGMVSHDDQYLFEMLCLEGMQAGLSWLTILNKRPALRTAFKNFNPDACANLTESNLKELLQNPGIIRNKAKIYAVRRNARAFLKVQQQFGSFDNYLWKFVGGKQIINKPKSTDDAQSQSELSKTFAKDLKQRGFVFVGPVTIYSFLQAVGVINDHSEDCFMT